jgi:hypothetical protein
MKRHAPHCCDVPQYDVTIWVRLDVPWIALLRHAGSVNALPLIDGSFSKYVQIPVIRVFWYILTQNHEVFLADEHIYNLLVRKKSKFDKNLFWILRNRSWDMSQIVKMACYNAENMLLTLFIKVLDIIQQCKIHLFMLDIAQKRLIILYIAKNHNKMQLNKNKTWFFN